MAKATATSPSPKLQDLTGQRFGRLTVIRRAADVRYSEKAKRVCWLCRCDCGRNTRVVACSLRGGLTKSCGCLVRKHGEAVGGRASPEYDAWRRMLSRCYNSKDVGFTNYGGRGISVCERWRTSFANFLADMGRRPSPRHSLDRIDNGDDYKPGNVRWAPRVVQNRNRRNNHVITFDGVTKTLAAWSEQTGIKAPTIRRRLKLGWSVAKTLTEPVASAG